MQKMTMKELVHYLNEASEPLTVVHGQVFNAEGEKVAELMATEHSTSCGYAMGLYVHEDGEVEDAISATDRDKIAALISYGSTPKGFELLVKGFTGVMVLKEPQETENVLRKLAELIDDTRKHYNDAQI